MKMLSILATCAFLVVGGAWVTFNVFYRVVVKTDYHPHQSKISLELKDDDVSELGAAFNPEFVDRRLLDQWEVNSSAATLQLDCPDMQVDRNPEFDILYPSYKDAINSLRRYGYEFLPSANLVDGAAKQFDDGLYAAIDMALYTGKLDNLTSPVDWVEQVAAKLDSGAQAKAFLAAALELAGKEMELDPSLAGTKDQLLQRFEENELLSKPIAFYAWNDELKWIWRFSKFLQHEFDETQIPGQIAAVLSGDAELLESYKSLVAHAGQMSNPANCLSLDQLQVGKTMEELAATHNVSHPSVAIFPASTSKETELFDRLFARGRPENVNFMSALIERILSGEVDLAPRDNSGWYDQQVYALETLLIPGAGQENDKLLLTARYKKRLLEAFKSMITKRRETHARQLSADKSTTSKPREPESIEPRLRVEPCATYYLRTARAYRFVANFLGSTLSKKALQNLKGLRKNGDRGKSLADELLEMQNRSYGLYLVVCDDIGMAPQFATDEAVDQEACYALACQWLEQVKDDRDLAIDTRVAVPISYDIVRERTKLWATVGVRLARLDCKYLQPPKIRVPGEKQWQDPKTGTLKPKRYVIAVDQWAELEGSGTLALTRDELRAICNKHKTLEAIAAAIK